MLNTTNYFGLVRKFFGSAENKFHFKLQINGTERKLKLRKSSDKTSTMRRQEWKKLRDASGKNKRAKEGRRDGSSRLSQGQSKLPKDYQSYMIYENHYVNSR
jgi:hypothetical protein